MDRLEAMGIFVRVAEMGSFSAVAQQLNVARSMVTRQIAGLEAHLGVKLMVRSTRRLSLTSAGAGYLEKCRSILELVESAESGAGEERLSPRGSIRVSLPLRFGLVRLAPLLLEFARRYPEVSLDMDYSDRRVNLIEESVDLCVRIARNLADGDVARRIGTVQMHLLASPAYLERHGRPTQPADLLRHTCLGYTANGPQVWQFKVKGQWERVPVRARIHSNNGEVLMEAAAQGMGITIQPDFNCETYLAEGSVERVLTEFPLPEYGVFALLPSSRQVPHRVRVLMDHIHAALAGDPAEQGCTT